MARLMTRCPNTTRLLDLHFRLPRLTLERMPAAEVKVNCELCGQQHTLHKSDMLIADEPSGLPRTATGSAAPDTRW
jgi:hypothetical protein